MPPQEDGAGRADVADLREQVPLHFALEAARAGLWDGDVRTGEVRVSAFLAQLLGYTPEHAPRTLDALHAHIAASHRFDVLRTLRDYTEAGGPFEIELPVTTPAGDARWIRARGEIVHERGVPARTRGAMFDITEQRVAEARQQDRERFLRAVTERLPFVVFVWDRDSSQVVYANERLGEQLGYPAAEFAALWREGLHTLIHPEDRVRRDRDRVSFDREQRVLAPYDLRLRQADGTYRWYRVLLSPFGHDAAGEVRQLLGTLEDIHESRREEAVRRARERELESAQAIARVGSWTHDLATHELQWSRELYRIAGLDPATSRPSGDTLEAMMSGADRARLRRAHERHFEGGASVDERVEIVRADGTRRVLQALTELVRNDAGDPIAFVGTLQDVTDQVRAAEERERLEQQVRQTQKLESLGLLAGGIAHDFNNLLVGILANASLAILDLADRPSVRATVEEIEQAAQRAADLTRQLLAYSGKGRFVTGPVEMGGLVREMASLLRTVVHKQVSLEVSTAARDAVVDGDATQLRQVIMNLITNASDACAANGGTVTLTVERGDERPARADAVSFGDPVSARDAVCIVVRDDGLGMPRETIDRIFDPFFTTKFTGRGLGLAATLGIVRGHRGTIEVWSHPGAGTEVVLRFPSTTSAIPGPARPDATAVAGHGRLLVVDDDVVVRTVARSLLSRRGFDADVVADGRAAISAFERDPTRYRAILIDLTMPGLSGIETARELRAREQTGGHPRCPIILMSGYNQEEIGTAGTTLALAGFLQKPFTLADLDRVLGHAFATR